MPIQRSAVREVAPKRWRVTGQVRQRYKAHLSGVTASGREGEPAFCSSPDDMSKKALALYAMPGKCDELLTAAKRKGRATVLSSGPCRDRDR
jgi:hypothetical protein